MIPPTRLILIVLVPESRVACLWSCPRRAAFRHLDATYALQSDPTGSAYDTPLIILQNYGGSL